MPSLETRYMNLNLKNPIIVASSGLTNSVEKISACEEAGAGAVVIKSMFEEVLAKDDWGLSEAAPYHPEAHDYLNAEIQLQYGPNDYCDLITRTKSKVDIPVIASINCISAKWWAEFASKVENAGADALELNIFSIPTNPDEESAEREKVYYDVLDSVKAKIKIPVAMKIGRNFTSLPNLLSQLDKRGLNGVVLFNRFTEPDIDIHNLKMRTTFSFSTQDEIHTLLRWIALVSPLISTDISATTGIHTAEGIIKLLLAGSSTVQLASVLYKNGLGVIKKMLDEISQWMDTYHLNSIEDFKGRVGFSPEYDPEVYLRAQFMEKIRGIE
jgi:dihydroorotate dehydrogenase (fumarate)